MELTTGLIDKIKRDAGRPDPFKPLLTVRRDEPLTPIQLVPAFLILSGGLVASAIAFLCERLAASWGRHSKEKMGLDSAEVMYGNSE